MNALGPELAYPRFTTYFRVGNVRRALTPWVGPSAPKKIKKGEKGVSKLNLRRRRCAPPP